MNFQRLWLLLSLLWCSNVMAMVLMVDGAQKCECAAFAVAENEEGPGSKEPMMSENPLNITCDDEGAIKCQQLCINLVQLGRDRAPEILCSQLNHADPFQPSLWTRCGDTWSFSGLRWDRMICCHDSLPVQCPIG